MGRRLIVALLLATAGSAASAGDLAYPVEGWALVGRWRLGSAARSAREGWTARPGADRGWKRLAPGARLPESPSGLWLRAGFEWEAARWREPVLTLDSLPAGARAWLNGVELAPPGPWPIAPRRGANLVAVVVPSGAVAGAPALSVRAVQRSTGAPRQAAGPRPWRIRADQVEATIPAAWLKGPDGPGWRTGLPGPLTGSDPRAPAVPVCLKATLDLPAYWKAHAVSLFLHGLAGRPDVWVNGVRVAEAVASPARIDLDGRLALDGRDTLCLVYAAPPAGEPEDGRWGVAALHWAASPAPPRLAPGATLLVDAAAWPGAPGIRRALRVASEILAVSATPMDLGWAPAWCPPERAVDAAGALLVPLCSTVFRASEFQAALAAAALRCDRLSALGAPRLWLLAPPTAGRRRDTVDNSRLQTFNAGLAELAQARGARLVPLYEVFRSALKRSRRWPVRVALSEDDGALTPAGAFVAGVVVLDTLALP